MGWQAGDNLDNSSGTDFLSSALVIRLFLQTVNQVEYSEAENVMGPEPREEKPSRCCRPCWAGLRA